MCSYFRIFSPCFLITFLSAVIAPSIDMLFLVYYNALWYPVYRYKQFCQFALFLPQ
jgi:hypothetical protein